MRKTKTSYLLRGTPSALLVLGAGFVMASSDNVFEALGMGAAVIISMLLTSVIISALHKVIPTYAKLPAYLLIITGFVSIISMVMEAYFPNVVEMLGVHLAALAVSAVIYRDAEEVADHNGEATSIKTALVTGVFFTVVMLICAVVRELICVNANALFGNKIEFLADYQIAAAAGAFVGYVVLAIVMAVINKITGLHHHLDENEEKEDNK